MLIGVNVPSEEMIKEVREQFKASNKGRRSRKQKQRRNKKANKWSNNNKWDKGTLRWDNKKDFTQEKYE